MIEAKFRSDALWNYGSLVIQVIAGLLMNCLLLMRIGPEAVGVFHQIYAVYVIAGQIVSLGLHDSAQKHVAQYADAPVERDCLAAGATFLVVLYGAVGAIVLAATSGLIGLAADSIDVGHGVLLVAPGLLLFVTSKVLMGILNGKRRMIAFAIGQSIRAVAILVACIVVIERNAPLSALGLCFTSGELATLCYLVFVARPFKLRRCNWSLVQPWFKVHAFFGIRAAVNSTLSETFFRVDILTLALFLPDRQVGIYSFAAFFLEGLYMVPVTIRYLANPILVRLINSGEREPLRAFARRVAAFSLAITMCIAICLLVVFPYFSYFAPEPAIGVAWSLLCILVLGLVVYSALIPFDYILLQAGRPGAQSIFMALATCLNATLNLLLIPAIGLHGAAVATSISFIASTVGLYGVTSLLLGMKGGIFLNR